MDSVPENAAQSLHLIQVDQAEVQKHLDSLVRDTVEQTLNALLDAEADALCGAKKYQRSPDRLDTRAGHSTRKLHTKAGEVELKVPKLRTLPFETAIIERYRRRETSVEEALVEMYLAGVSVRRVEDITEALWGLKVSSSTISELNKKIYGQIEAWRNQPIAAEHPYVYLDGIWLKRTWGGEVRNVAVLVAAGVNRDGFREVLGVMEGAKEDTESWRGFLRHLKGRGLQGVRLVISDKCLGLVEALGEFYPEAAWQRCVVHFYRNVFTVVPRGKAKEVAAMLKAIHAQEDRDAALQKAEAVAAKLDDLRLAKAAGLVRAGIAETLAYMAFPREHWRSLRTNNPLERVMRELRRRTRVVGCFPDGESAVMLVGARLRHLAGTRWGTRRYLDMDRLLQPDAGLLPLRQLDQRLGFTHQLAAALQDRRAPDLIEHSLLDLLRRRLYGILAGYEDQNDHDTLRSDPVFKLLADRWPTDPDLASQPTLSRFENAVTIGDLKRLRRCSSISASPASPHRHGTCSLTWTPWTIRPTVSSN